MGSHDGLLSEEKIVVIGAGTTGSSTAYHLAKSGNKTVLIDKNQIGSGMTSRSSAIVRTHYSNEIVARMALYSRDIFENFKIGNSGFVKSGMLILVPKALRAGAMENIEMLNRMGATNVCLSPDESRAKFPEINYDGVDFVDYEPESGYADSVGVANAYARAAEKLGAEIRTGASVRKLLVEDRQVKGVILEDGTQIDCSKVVLCTNIWTNKILQASGIDLSQELFPLWAAAHPVAVFKRPKTYGGIRPVVWDYEKKTYAKPEGESLFFVGSLDSAIDNTRTDPDNYPDEVPFETIDAFATSISSRIPAMSLGSFHSSYVGVYDLTPDQHPIIDELSSLGLGGVCCCVGLSGHGFKLCPALGLMTSELVQGLPSSIFDRSVFSLERFKKRELLQSRYVGLATIS